MIKMFQNTKPWRAEFEVRQPAPFIYTKIERANCHRNRALRRPKAWISMGISKLVVGSVEARRKTFAELAMGMTDAEGQLNWPLKCPVKRQARHR